MAYAGVHARSFEEASGFCRELAELDIQGRRIGRFVLPQSEVENPEL